MGLSQNWMPTLGLGPPVLGHTNTTWQFLLISEWVYCHFAKHQKHLWYLIPVLTKHELKGQICFRTPKRHSSNSSNMCQLTMFPAVHTARHWKNWNAQSAAESAMVLPCHFQHRLHRTTGRWDHSLGLSWETVGQLGWSYIWHLMILCSQLGPAWVFPVLPRALWYFLCHRQICLWQSLTKTSTHTISSTSITSNQQHMSKNLTFCIVSTYLSKSVGTVLVTFLESLLRRCVLKPSGALVSSVISGAASQIVEKGKKEHTDMCTVCI